MKKKPLSSVPSRDLDGNSQSLLHNHSTHGRENSGCITSILRRILCISNLPSSRFDHVKDDEQDTNYSLVEASTPSVVARLMGLESIPQIPSIRKSITSQKVMRYRKIISTHQDLEDDNFFILSFDHQDRRDDEGCTEFSLKPRKSKRQRRKKNPEKRSENLLENCNKENGFDEEDSNKNIEERQKDSCSECKNSKAVLAPVGNSNQKPLKIRKNNMVSVHTEADPENSSPNSVLDFVEFPLDHAEPPYPGNSISRSGNTKLRKTLCEVLKSLEKPEKEKRLIKDVSEEDYKPRKIRQRINRKHKSYYAEVKWVELASMEMARTSWLDVELSKNCQHCKEIGRDLASEILDQLLDELDKF